MKYAIILGGNVGNVEKNFAAAVALLEAGGWHNLKKSALFASKAVDCVPNTPDFLNQALVGEWQDSPEALLGLGQRTERALGRPAQHSSAESRPIDCDIVLAENLTVNLPDLQIPHPRARQRNFVLKPLAEIAPDWTFPDGVTVQEAYFELNRPDGD